MSPANPNHVRHATNHVNPDNPIFGREDPKMPRDVSMGQAEAVQTGTAPLPTTGTPMLNEDVEAVPGAQEPSPVAEAGTVYLDSDQKPVGVSDGEKIVPLDLEKTPHMMDGSGPLPVDEDEEDETEETRETAQDGTEPSTTAPETAPVEEQKPEEQHEEQPA